MPATVASHISGNALLVPVDSGSRAHVAARRRRRPHGAVAAEEHDHARAPPAHGGDERAGVRGRAGERVELHELDRRPPRRARPSPVAGPHDATGHAHGVGGHEHGLDPGRARRRDEAQHHVGLLGVGEHRGLRDEPADVAPGHRVGHDAQGRAGHHGERPRGQPVLRHVHEAHPRGRPTGHTVAGGLHAGRRPPGKDSPWRDHLGAVTRARTPGAVEPRTKVLAARSGSTTSMCGASR